MKKKCTKCLEEKNLEDFYKSERYKYGCKTWCKSCCNLYAVDRRKKIIRKCIACGNNIIGRGSYKYCEDCHEPMSREDLRVNAQKHFKKYYIKNKESEKKRKAEWYLKNKDRLKAKQKAYRANKKKYEN